MKAGHGVNALTGGIEVHLALVDMRAAEPELSGPLPHSAADTRACDASQVRWRI